MAQIKSPVPGFTGTTYLGSTRLDFQDGVATVEGELGEGQRAYLAGAGYGIGSSSPVTPEVVEPADPRDFDTPTQVGTRTRDAAVDPEPGDFLPPTNAGQANPHGPLVVSPEVHASEGVRPVKPGDVHVGDTDAQSAAEVEHAEVHATTGEPVLDSLDGPGPLVADADPDAQPTAADAAVDGTDAGATPAGELKGAALDDALAEAGLSKSGTADEKRARLAEARA